MEFYFRFCFQLYYHYRHVVFYQPSKYHLHLYRTTYCGNITSYQFFKMAATAAQYYFRFRICWCQCLQKVNIYHQTKFHRHTSIRCWYITTSVFEKQTSAILEFYFRLRSIPFFRNLCVILHQATEFRPNLSIHGGNMKSYPFLKMAAATAKYYFRFRICWCHCLQKLKVYQQPNFVDISQLTIEIQLLLFLKNKRLLYSNSTSGFDLDHFLVICMLLCIRLPNFVQMWPLNTTSCFVFVNVTAFRRSKSISKPNFVDISQLTIEI